MCPDTIHSRLHELVKQFHTADRHQRRKLITHILSLAQQSDEFWQGTSIDIEPYAEAYQSMMTLLPRQLHQFDSSELTFVQWLNRLLVAETLARSPKIWRGGGKTDSEIYEEAKQIATKEILEKFDRYDSKKGSVLNWFDFLLKNRIKDLEKRRSIKHKQELSFIEDGGEDNFTNKPDHITNIGDEIDFNSLKTPDLTYDAFLMRKLINRIRQWAQDKHAELCKCSLRDRSDVNCFTLILKRLPQLVERQGEVQDQGKFEFSNVPTWGMIATELDVAESTVRCHFTKHCIRHLKQAFPTGSYA